MTNYQNRRRWAVRQQELARRLNTIKREAEERSRGWIAEWNNMYFGNLFDRYLRGERD